jgi:hypothetical protein
MKINRVILIEVIILRLDKNMIIVFLLLSVFAVGILSLNGTVEAAKWKKFDSGSYNIENPDKEYKKTISYNSYSKGSNKIKVEFILTKTKDNKKVHSDTLLFTKKGKYLYLKGTDYTRKPVKVDKDTYKTKISVKNFYNSYMNIFVRSTYIQK